jgi:hypothetical protein
VRALLLVLLAGCAGLAPPDVDPDEHVRGEHHRLIHEPVDRLWPMLVDALPGEGIRVLAADRARGTITTRPVHHEERDAPRRLAEIGDLGAARRAGLRRVSEFVVSYALLVRPADAGTSLRIRSSIEAVDHGSRTFLGGGLIPRRIPVESRGVLERELMRRLGASLFTAEEMLHLLGEPGID